MPSNSELSLLTKCLDLDDVKVINFGFIPEFGLVISVENKCPIVECPKCQSKTGRVNRNDSQLIRQFHWILDVGFREDASQSCLGHSAENLAVIRHVGLNLLSRDKKTKVGVKGKCLKAGWDDNYLKEVLSDLNISIV